MSIPARPPRPNLGSAPEEESQVLRRTPVGQSPPGGAPANTTGGEAPAHRPRMSSAPGEITSHERLERKLKLGQKLLTELPASNEHARLLSVAVMRRDEALLDGVLKALGQKI